MATHYCDRHWAAMGERAAADRLAPKPLEHLSVDTYSSTRASANLTRANSLRPRSTENEGRLLLPLSWITNN